MSAGLKLIVVLFVVVFSCVQFIEMARIPRDGNAAAQGPTSDLAISLQNFLDDITKKFETIVADDSLKKLLSEFEKTLGVPEGSTSENTDC